MSARLPILPPTPPPPSSNGAGSLASLPPGAEMVDAFGRRIEYLRISVTDRCNLRCVYCMPADGIDWIPRREILTYEEIERVVRVMAAVGLSRVRLTGGEPTVRRDLVELVTRIARVDGIRDLSMTTNGLKLRAMAAPLVEAGMKRFNVSLDTLDPQRFATLTRGGDVARVLDGIDAVLELGLPAPVKVNAVVVGGVNDGGDAVALVRRFADANVVVRFIEHMPFTDVDAWRAGAYVPLAAVRDRLVAELGIEPGAQVDGSGPAENWSVPGARARVGFIHPVSEHFCAACNRMRLSATGELRPCLGHVGALSLAGILRSGGDDAALRAAIAATLAAKPFKHDFAENPDEAKGVMTAIGG